MSEPPDDLAPELRAMPRHDADDATADRIGRAALAAFVDAHETRGRPWLAFAARAARAATPLVVVGTVGVYLTWAVSAANALFP